MKKILILFSAVFILGCSDDLLIEEPKSLAVENFYNTPAEIEAAVYAIYAPLRDGNCLGGLYPAQQEAMADYGYGRGSYAAISDYAGLDPTNITRVGQMWDLFYRSIRNANLVIQNAPLGIDVSPEQANAFVAEARYLRAFVYFTMVQNWGGIPLRTEENLTEPNIERATEDEVYQLILQDLMFAEENLPATVGMSGRPSLWAAKTLLADVHLHLEQWPEARDKAAEVINSGEYSLINVNTPNDFLEIYGPNVITTPEEIFYMKFSAQSNYGWFYVMFAHHPGSGYHGAGGYYGHYSDTVANSIIKNWDENDLRKTYNLYNWDIGLGPTTVLYRKFRDEDAPTSFGAANDYPIYRYADLLLIHAEAASRASGGPTAAAVESLNKVHRRAYGHSPTVFSPVDFDVSDFDANSFLDMVLQERGFETMYEGKRWLDLKRLGIAQEVIKEVKGIDVAEKHLLWPIPISEMNFNEALDPIEDQNPGY